MPIFDFLLVRRPKLGLLDLYPPHHVLDSNNNPLLGPPRPKKKEWKATRENDLRRTSPRRVFVWLSLVASWRPPELQLGLRRVANVGKGRPWPIQSSPVWRGATFLTLI